MSMRQVNGDVVMMGTKAAGTFTSNTLPVGYAADVIVAVHVTAATGTSPSLAVSLEESSDGTTWTPVSQSAALPISAAGNTLANAQTTKQLVRVTATITGTTPSFTFRVAVLAFAE
jgi:hypothetical protein